MASISKQDLNAPRTAADIERRYNFGKSFAEVMGIATDARDTAAEAKKAASDLDVKLTHEEIFKILTDDGKMQGIYRDDDGQIYINAEYINFDELNGKNLTMTGTFTNTVSAFIEPGEDEAQIILAHIGGNVTLSADLIPLYDFNSDGVVDGDDYSLCMQAIYGTISLADWAGAVKTEVTMTIDLSNPDKAIKISGKNMWGRQFEQYIGLNGTSYTDKRLMDFVVEEGTRLTGGGNYPVVEWSYRVWNSGKAECWGKQSVTGAFTTSWNGLYAFDTVAQKSHYPIYFKEPPVETVTVRSSVGACLLVAESSGNGLNTTNTTAAYNAVRPAELTSTQTVTYMYYVVGEKA